jgi:hypothetical protein
LKPCFSAACGLQSTRRRGRWTVDHVAGVREHGGDVGGDEVLRAGAGLADAGAAEADQQRRAVAGDDDRLRVGVVDDGDAPGPVHLRGGADDGAQQVAVVGELLLDEVGDHLGVGLAGEAAAASGQGGPQLGVVLDDAVVDDGDAADAVRVGVDLGRAAVGRPARVADAAVAGDRRGAELVGERGDLALATDEVEAVRAGRRSVSRPGGP